MRVVSYDPAHHRVNCLPLYSRTLPSCKSCPFHDSVFRSNSSTLIRCKSQASTPEELQKLLEDSK